MRNHRLWLQCYGGLRADAFAFASHLQVARALRHVTQCVSLLVAGFKVLPQTSGRRWPRSWQRPSTTTLSTGTEASPGVSSEQGSTPFRGPQHHDDDCFLTEQLGFQAVDSDTEGPTRLVSITSSGTAVTTRRAGACLPARFTGGCVFVGDVPECRVAGGGPVPPEARQQLTVPAVRCEGLALPPSLPPSPSPNQPQSTHPPTRPSPPPTLPPSSSPVPRHTHTTTTRRFHSRVALFVRNSSFRHEC